MGGETPTENGTTSTTMGMLWGHRLDPQLPEKTSLHRDFHLLISEIHPSQEGPEKTMLLLHSVIDTEIEASTIQESLPPRDSHNPKGNTKSRVKESGNVPGVHEDTSMREKRKTGKA